jgi:hypothetical protein
MEFDWCCTGWLLRSNKAASGFFGFQKTTSEPAGKEGSLKHDIWCLITNTWANRVVIVNSVITRYLTLAKVGWSTFALQSCSCTIQLHLILHHKLFICCYSLSCLLFCIRVQPFCSVILNSFLFSVRPICFVFDYLIFDYSFFFVLILEMCSRYFNPHNNNHLESKITSYTRPSPVFVLVQEARA